MTDQPAQKTDDYKSTVFLPQTDFPMRGDLPKHGFARHLPWVVHPPRLAPDHAHLVVTELR